MQIATVGAGVILFDLLFCHFIAPKVFEWLDLTAEPKGDCCAECQRGHECKNVTNRSQVIEMEPFSQYRLLSEKSM